MAKVILENLVKIYPDKKGQGVRAIDGINLTVEAGEFMVLVGPSGCGKSTTLRMIAGLEEISEGSVSIDGRVMNDIPPKDRDVAMVFQNYALYPHMSVFDNMAFGLKLRKYSKVEIGARVREAAVLLGLEDLLDRKPKTLSGGQRQRVAVGRAIVRRPKVFLFDEPLSNLDAKMRIAMRMELARLHARLGTTMIYVTHDQIEAMTMGDRICVMKDGSIMQLDEPLALYNRPENLFVAGFIGSPQMNFFNGSVRSASDGLVFTASDEAAVPPLKLGGSLARRAAGHVGRPAVLGIRPEDFSETPMAGEGRGSPVVQATVELFEPMGAETFLHVRLGQTLAIARARPTARFELNQKVTLALNLDRAHLFDAATGRQLQ